MALEVTSIDIGREAIVVGGEKVVGILAGGLVVLVVEVDVGHRTIELQATTR